MSDDLIIREDGIGRLIRGVDALEIKLQNGGTSRWVRFNPRDQKSVSANGEYHAKDDEVDGYRTITVNVPTRTQSQTPGRDQEIFNPGTGTVYYTDDEGMLHEELLPNEIRIMHVPDKTTYQDGEPIDLEGIMVQAYRDGEVWTSEQYPDGYIPANELTVNPAYASVALSKEMAVIPEYMRVSDIAETASIDAITNVLTHNFPENIEDEARQEAVTNAIEIIRGAFSGALSDAGGGFAFYSWGGTPSFGPGTEWSMSSFWGIQILTEDLGNGRYRYTEYEWSFVWYGWGDNMGLHLTRSGPYYGTWSLYQGVNAQNHISNVNAPTKRVMKCEVTWHRPTDRMNLSDSFEITVEAAS